MRPWSDPVCHMIHSLFFLVHGSTTSSSAMSSFFEGNWPCLGETHVFASVQLAFSLGGGGVLTITELCSERMLRVFRLSDRQGHSSVVGTCAGFDLQNKRMGRRDHWMVLPCYCPFLTPPPPPPPPQEQCDHILADTWYCLSFLSQPSQWVFLYHWNVYFPSSL